MDHSLKSLRVFKRILITLSVGVVLLAVAVLALPWWWGTAVRQVGGDYGVTFSTYERVGYGRWMLKDVAWRQSGVVLQADRVEAPHPLGWWWRKSAASPVLIDGLKLDLSGIEKEAGGSEGGVQGPRSAIAMFHRIEPLLPPVKISSARMVVAEQSALAFEDLSLVGFDLGIARITFEEFSASLALRMATDDFAAKEGHGFEFTVRESSGNWAMHGQSSPPNDQLNLQGEWLGQEFSGFASFVSDLWVPDSGEIRAEQWTLPAAAVGLDDYYKSIAGRFELNWNGNRFHRVLLAVESESEETSETPPLSVMITGSAGGESVEVETLQILSPGLSVSTDEPFEISQESAIEGAVTHLQVQADLAEFPLMEGRGTMAGSLKLTTRSNAWPLMEFALDVSEVGIGEYPSLSGMVGFNVAWPEWAIDTLSLRDEAGSRVRLEASGNGLERRIENGLWAASVVPASVQAWAPSEISWNEINSTGVFQGSYDEIDHEGELQADDILVNGLKPLAVTGNWSGRGKHVDGALVAKSGEAQANISGGVQASQAQLEIELRRGDERIFQSPTPLTVSWQEGLSVADLDIKGPGIALSSSRFTAAEGTVKVDLSQPDWTWLGDWWEAPPEVPEIRKLQADLVWRDGQLTGAAVFDGNVPVSEGVIIQMQFDAVSDGKTVDIARGELGWENEAIASVRGELPLRFLTTSPYWEINAEGEIDARMVLERSPNLWRKLAQESRVRVESPTFDLELGGTWQRPTGKGRLSVDKITVLPKPGETSWPIITAVEAQLVDDGSGLAVDPLQARFDGQAIVLRGQLPFTPEEWSEVSDAPMRYFREQGRGSISIPRADLAALAKFVPDMLVPTGEVEVALEYAPGRGVDGQIQLRGAVTRPLGPLGALQDVTADLRFANRGLDVREVRALMGGQRVELSGDANWPESGEVELDLALRGRNLPLVRSTGILLRSDLDLRIRSDSTGAGEVSGEARLRDGLILVDVRSLLPKGGGAAVPGRRPPFFSVGVEPLNHWNLDVRVSGEKFLRLRTPVVTGTASVDVRLDGTLETPRSIGDISLDEGELRLPFARLTIDEAFAQLTDVDPYDPEIRLDATGQRLGYDLTFALSGKASDPRLDLQASPTLTSEEVLLLVMAGVTPQRNGQSDATNRALKLGMYFSQGVLGDLLGTDENGRLTVSTGEKLSRQGKETFRFDYELADRWNVVAEYDEFDHYNAALKWRVIPGAVAEVDSTETASSDPETSEEQP